MDVFDALIAHGDIGEQVIDVLYGDAEEIRKGLVRELIPVNVSKSTGPFSNELSFTVPNKGRLVRLNIKNSPDDDDDDDDDVKPKGKKGKKQATRKVEKSAPGIDWDQAKYIEISKGTHDIEWTGTFSKMDTDKRQVFGWASVTSVDGVPVEDLQGDVIDLDEIEKAAYDYVMTSRKGGNMHKRNGEEPLHVSDMIESFVVTPEKKEALGISKSVGNEGWWVGFQVHDDATWEAAKRGELAGFSIHGRGRRS